MKKTIQSILAATAVALTSGAVHAQSTVKILTVDVAKVLEGYYKTQDEQEKFKADEQKAQTQLATITKEGNALVDQYKELDEQSKNPASTAEAKAKVQGEMQKKGEEIQQKKQEQNAFIQTTRQTMQQRIQTFRQLMVEEISKASVDIAKKKGATFLLDKSGPTLLGVSSVLYSEPSLDITDEVLAEVNKDRPAVTTAPAAAASSSPGATDSPKITVPGISPSK